MAEYKQINHEERVEISLLFQQGYSRHAIARELGRNVSSISREIKRNSHWKDVYLPDHAHCRALGRRHKRSSVLFTNPDLRRFVVDKLRLCWSPHTISGYLKEHNPTQTVSAETIYTFVYTPCGRRLELYKCLKQKHKKRYPRGSRKKRGSTIPNRTSIQERSEEANTRQEVGHWEADLIINKGGNVAVMCERQTRYLIAVKNPSKHTKTVMKGIMKHMKKLPEELRLSMTFDQGTEFTNHQDLQRKCNMKTFFCHPYSPWQKGSVENANGRIRRFIPKRADISTVSQKELDQIIHLLNNTPRECLGFKTPQDLFSTYSTECCTSS